MLWNLPLWESTYHSSLRSNSHISPSTWRIEISKWRYHKSESLTITIQNKNSPSWVIYLPITKKQTPRICVKYTSAKLSKRIYNFPNLKSRIQKLQPRFLSSDRISFKGKEICLIKNIFFWSKLRVIRVKLKWTVREWV